MRATHRHATPSFSIPSLLLHDKRGGREESSPFIHRYQSMLVSPPSIALSRENEGEIEAEREIERSSVRLLLPLLSPAVECPTTRGGRRGRGGVSDRSRRPEWSDGGPLCGPPFSMEPSRSAASFVPDSVPTGLPGPSHERRPPPVLKRHSVGSDQPPSASLAVAQGERRRVGEKKKKKEIKK